MALVIEQTGSTIGLARCCWHLLFMKRYMQFYVNGRKITGSQEGLSVMFICSSSICPVLVEERMFCICFKFRFCADGCLFVVGMRGAGGQ